MNNFEHNQSPQNGDKYNVPFFQRNQKTTRIVAIIVLAILALTIIIGACVGCYFAGRNAEYVSNMNEELAVANEVYTMIKNYYYQDISREEFNKWASIGLSSVMDQFSGLSLSSASPTLQFGLSIKNDSYNNHIISDIGYGSPASNAKGRYVNEPTSSVALERGDIIVSVDGKSVEGLASDVLNGSDFLGNSELNRVFEIIVKKSNGKQAKFLLKKSLFNTKEANYINLSSVCSGVGYIKLKSFTGTAAEDFVQCANQFTAAGNNKLILDLRDNGGGSTNILSVIASYLIHDTNGKSNGLGIIKLKSEKSQQVATYTAEGDNWLGKNKDGYKLVVLVNEGSASASEALLGAIKYYCPEATVIGSPTYGKGIAQQTFELSSTKDYLLSMTVGYFYVPVASVNGGQDWRTYHGESMLPSADKYTIEKFSSLLDFTADDAYKSYYNNVLTEEKAMQLAFEVLQ